MDLIWLLLHLLFPNCGNNEEENPAGVFTYGQISGWSSSISRGLGGGILKGDDLGGCIEAIYIEYPQLYDLALRPMVSLNNKGKIASGSGTETSPYILE